MTTALRLPLAKPSLGRREEELVVEVLRSGTLSLGPMTARFERSFADRVGRRFAVACASGTGGLHTALHAAGVGPGDEVLTPSFGFISSANVILYQGATPVFVEIDDETLNLDPSAIDVAITGRTRAILPVHMFGHPCEMPAIMRSARAQDLAVVEDGCEALLATLDGRVVGDDGNPTVYAFYANKQMTTGEGGMITTDDERLERTLRSLINQGRAAGGAMAFDRLGFNYRMSDVTAAIGVGQLERIDDLLAERERVAGRYLAALAAVDGVRLPAQSERLHRSWFVFPIRLASGISRDGVAEHLAAAGVQTRPYMPAIHLQREYVERFGYRPGMLPVTEAASNSSLVLPFYPGMTDEEIAYAVEHLRAAIDRAS
jgi:perosamine synthetase